MTSKTERIAEHFGELVELDGPARAVRMESIRASEPALAKELEDLLRAHHDCGDFLGALEVDRAEELLQTHSSPAAAPPVSSRDRVGPYRLGPALGRGGMGVVHLAERVDGGFEQRVAIKLIRPDADRQAIHRRFLAERQILARLEHRNVARLLDGGVTDDGRPFFAMEYVDGDAITDWCDDRAADVDARLRLFLQVCDAVAYAHANLVIHRDLKPSNVLIDHAGEPKLLDFGIAQLLRRDDEAPRRAGETELTALTPEYAAPEQLSGDPITTAADVYSLGVVLYELLTGARPRPIGDDERLERPSFAVLPAVGGSAESNERQRLVAELRGTTVRRLSRRLAGDLDAILARALQPEAEERYESAAALAGDLRRHLNHLPVVARSYGGLARATKFARRHRAATVAGLAIALVLGLGVGLVARQTLRAARQAKRAQEALTFLGTMLQRADPAHSSGTSVTAVDLLDEGALWLEADASLDSTVRAELADVLGRTYRSLGRIDEAESAVLEAYELFRDELGLDHSRTLLARLSWLEVVLDRGDIESARLELEALVPNLVRVFGERSDPARRARSAYARALAASGEFEAALTVEQTLFAMSRERVGLEHPDTVERAVQLAGSLKDVGRFAESEEVLRQTLQTLDDAGRLSTPQGAQVKTSLAVVLDLLGRDGEADSHFVEALELARSTLGEEHPQVAQILVKRGIFLVERRRSAEAQDNLDRAIAILEPLGHYDAGAAMRYLGFLHLGEERLAEATDAFEGAREVLAEKLGDDHSLALHAEVAAAYSAARIDPGRDAESRLRRAIETLEARHGEVSNDVRMPLKYLGEIVRRAGRPDEAHSIHRRVLALERRLMGSDDNLSQAMTREQLALDLLAIGGEEELAEARRLCEASLGFLRQHEPEPGRLGRVLSTCGAIAAAAGDPVRARDELAEAVRLLDRRFGPDAPSSRTARAALGSLPREPRY